MDFGITGKRAVIQGGTSGLGFAVAEQLLREGAHCIIASRKPERVESALHSLRDKVPGAQVTGLTLDLDDEKSTNLFFDKVLSQGAIDILVNNTGGPAAGNALEIPLAQWDKGYHSLVRSVLLGCQRVVPAMKEKKWGRILNITSTSAVEVIPNLPVSGTFRAGLSALVKGLAKDLGQWNILINNLLPGPTKTDRLRELAEHSPDFFRSMESRSALKRLAEPEEIGRVGAFLCSSANSYMTGTDCLVDGASTASV